MTGLPWDQRLGRVVADLLARTPVTPNQVTTVILLLGLGSCLLYAQGERTLAVLASLLFMCAVFLDHVDGELARQTGRTSRFGHYYDGVAMGTSYIGMFAGVGMGLAGGPLGGWAVPLGILAGVAVFVIFSVRLRVEARYSKQETEQPRFAGFEVEDMLYLVGPITWIDGLAPFLVAAGIGTPAFMLWVLWEWRRAARAAEAEAAGS